MGRVCAWVRVGHVGDGGLAMSVIWAHRRLATWFDPCSLLQTTSLRVRGLIECAGGQSVHPTLRWFGCGFKHPGCRPMARMVVVYTRDGVTIMRVVVESSSFEKTAQTKTKPCTPPLQILIGSKHKYRTSPIRQSSAPPWSVAILAQALH